MKCLLWDGDLFHPRGGKRIADKLKERLLGDYFSSRTCARARVSTMGSCLYLRGRCDEREGGGGMAVLGANASYYIAVISTALCFVRSWFCV